MISFQEDANRDVFNPFTRTVKAQYQQGRQRAADYLCYTMLDLIVDNYYVVMERLGERIGCWKKKSSAGAIPGRWQNQPAPERVDCAEAQRGTCPGSDQRHHPQRK